MVSSVKSTISSSSQIDTKELDETLKSLVSTTWDDIQKNLESKQTADEKAFRSNIEKGIGAPSPLNKIRLYDESNKEEDIRVTLYRDHASWCPYCQKVWMTLEEKRIPYRVEKINMRCYGDKPREFMRLQPSGAVPVAVIDGTVYNQSNDIMFALESMFPEHKALLPPEEDQALRMKAQELLRLERTLFSAWMYWLTGSERSKGNFIRVLKEVESVLKTTKGGDFFMGEKVSLVDFMFAPFLERMCASMIFFKGFQIRVAKGQRTDYPAINKWFDAMEKLPSYVVTKSDYYTHAWDLPPQLGGCVREKGGELFERAINGERLMNNSRGSWDFPLVPDLGGIEPDWDFCGDENAAKREAAERLSFNHKNIVLFAARGAGSKGMPPFSAPLADPNATPNESVYQSVDTFLRLIAVALLDGHESVASDMAEVAREITLIGEEHTQNVVKSLSYLRDRIGVPRDMKLPAARQLRAHINFAISYML
jgi:glutathione S-transferase